ncbi:MAG: hypothetical protein D6739_03595 [Nitrospirae bacterium]|nr:MAG: hypothetical protein D6739_03595 [Nitrospirota bacterium]
MIRRLRVEGETPSILAAFRQLIRKGSRYTSLMNSPGWGGCAWPSVVVLVVDPNGSSPACGGRVDLGATPCLRWLQMVEDQRQRERRRRQGFHRALRQLEAACRQTSYTDLERAGLVQVFEFTFELAWKCLRDHLLYEGFRVASPRETLRQGFASGLLEETEVEALLDALEKRNLLAHTYDEKTAEAAVQLIRDRFFPALRRVAASLESRGEDGG